MNAIVDHIDEHRADHARCGEHTRVIALGAERPPAAPHERIDPSCEADFEPFDAARERTAIGGLDDEVHVIVLHREVRDANETAGVRLPQRTLDEGEPALRAQIEHVAREPQGDVHRVAPAVVRPARVRDARW